MRRSLSFLFGPGPASQGITNVDIPQIMIGVSYVIYFYYRLKVNKIVEAVDFA